MRATRQRHSEPALRLALQAKLQRDLVAGHFETDTGFAAAYEQVRRFQAQFGSPAVAAAARARQALPVELFKYQCLATFAPTATAASDRHFLSSGTTRGSDRRARHVFADFTLYESALLRGFVQAVPGVAAAAKSSPWNLLVPAGAAWWQNPHASLAHMGRTLWNNLDCFRGGQLHLIDPAMPARAFTRVLARLRASADSRTLGFGTSFGFLHLSDRLARDRRSVRLHPASWLFETGGYKGQGRDLAPAELHTELAARFGLPIQRVLTEYGMTELSSQAYAVPGVTPRCGAPFPDLPVYRPAASLRIRVLDPAGRPCAPGQLGLIEATDVMNLTSACRLLLGDVGVLVPEGRSRVRPGEFARRRFQVLGRASRLAARGCGLADDLRVLESR